MSLLNWKDIQKRQHVITGRVAYKTNAGIQITERSILGAFCLSAWLTLHAKFHLTGVRVWWVLGPRVYNFRNFGKTHAHLFSDDVKLMEMM